MHAEDYAIIGRLASALQTRGWTCAVAESCTGGLAGAVLTEFPGASAWFAGGIISYSNSVKEALLGVPHEILEQYGAVSEPVVLAMALGACKAAGADAALAISGIAGPDGGSADKPVGTVWIGIAISGAAHAALYHFKGDRNAVRRQAAAAAAVLLADAVEQSAKRSA